MQGSFGRMLQDAREHAGFDLTTMARRLHIRPDILRSIEQEDFERMPARGYSRNMVRAYARAVGLDQNQISNMYLDAVHLYETGSPRMSERDNQVSRFADQGSASRMSSRNDRQRETDRGRDGRASAGSRSFSSSGAEMGSRGRRSDGGGRGANMSGVGFGSLLGGVGISGSRQRQQDARRFTSPKVSSGYQSIYSSNNAASGILSRLPFLGIIALVAVIVILVIVFVFNSGSQTVDDVPDIPISGLTDTSNPEGVLSTTVAEKAPVNATFTYSVDSGSQSWITIYENGAETPTIAEVVTGPSTENITVTGTLRFETANPGPVHVSVDTTPLELTADPDSGMYTCTVDFAEILRKWEDDHPEFKGTMTGSSSSSSSSSASSSSSSSSASSSSASSSGS